MVEITFEDDLKAMGFTPLETVVEGDRWMVSYQGMAVNSLYKKLKRWGFVLVARLGNSLLWKKENLYVSFSQGLVIFTNKDLNAVQPDPIPEPEAKAFVAYEPERGHIPTFLLGLHVAIGIGIGWFLRGWLW